MSRGQSLRRTNSQKRALERCKSKGKASEFVNIDRICNFIIIDSPEPSGWTSPAASISGKDKKPECWNIIYIDDDDDDDSGDCSSSLNVFEEGGDQDTHCNQGRKFSSKSSKCWATCCRKASSLNQQNFSSGTLSENDDSDCDIVEDYLGNIRQQWETASLRKKRCENFLNGRCGSKDEVGPGEFYFDSQNNVYVGKTTEAPTPCSISANNKNDNFNPSMSIGEVAGGSSNKSDDEKQHTHLDEAIHQKMYKKSYVVCSTQDVKETTLRPSANTQRQVKANLVLLNSNGDDPYDAQNCILGDRELLKKTDAYKRAEEEEWASRQRELQRQAEEAQRLRKRRKAETLRLLERERRQKQRVEEVREAQKKDEETLNLKEQLRIEVRRELDKLEPNCRDMASLLCGLGIDTGGGLFPSSSDVRVAYKQALFRFHPDRASRDDIRQQIEAEEKFKLISRAKERFML